MSIFLLENGLMQGNALKFNQNSKFLFTKTLQWKYLSTKTLTYLLTTLGVHIISVPTHNFHQSIFTAFCNKTGFELV